MNRYSTDAVPQNHLDSTPQLYTSAWVFSSKARLSTNSFTSRLKFSLPPSCRSGSRRSFRLHRGKDVRWPWTHPWLRDGWMGRGLGTTLRRIWWRLRIRRWIRTLWKLVISQLLQLWWWLVILRQPPLSQRCVENQIALKLTPTKLCLFYPRVKGV